MADIEWAIPVNENDREGFAERATIYLTRSSEVRASSPAGSLAIHRDEDEGPGDEGIEMEEHKTLLPSYGEGRAEPGCLSICLRAGRPDLAMAVEQVFSHGGAEKVAIFVCGPKSLSRNLRGHVRPWVMKGRDVWFWDEAFGL